MLTFLLVFNSFCQLSTMLLKRLRLNWLNLAWKLNTAATLKKSMVAFLFKIVGLCVSLFWVLVFICSIHTVSVLPKHLKYILCYSTLEFGAVVDIFGISIPLLSFLLLFLLLFLSTSRGHCCWKREEGLYLTVTLSHICQSYHHRYNWVSGLNGKHKH